MPAPQTAKNPDHSQCMFYQNLHCFGGSECSVHICCHVVNRSPTVGRYKQHHYNKRVGWQYTLIQWANNFISQSNIGTCALNKAFNIKLFALSAKNKKLRCQSSGEAGWGHREEQDGRTTLLFGVV